MEIFHSFFTVVVLIVFVGVAIWAYSSKRKKDFEEAARLPFADDDKAGNRADGTGAPQPRQQQDRQNTGDRQ